MRACCHFGADSLRTSCGRRIVRRLLVSLLFVGSGATVLIAQYPATLTYLPRGDRKEGLASAPKSADAIVLVSAVADVRQRESLADWPTDFHLRFFYPREEPAPFVRVRQLRSLAGYYLLDSVVPTTPWTPGTVNDFSWKRDVVASVYDYQVAPGRRDQVTKDEWLAGLGVVVSLGPAGASGSLQSVTVAPAVIERSRRPLDVVNYLFTFRTNAPATVSGGIWSAANREVLPGLEYEVTAGSPFTVRWPVANQPEGWYRLTLDATLTGQPQIVVRFYHKRPSDSTS